MTLAGDNFNYHPLSTVVFFCHEERLSVNELLLNTQLTVRYYKQYHQKRIKAALYLSSTFAPTPRQPLERGGGWHPIRQRSSQSSSNVDRRSVLGVRPFSYA